MKHLLGLLLFSSGFIGGCSGAALCRGRVRWWFARLVLHYRTAVPRIEQRTLAQALILDGSGDVAYRQRVPNVSNFRVWPDGRMSYAARGKHLLMDATFTLVDSISCANGVLNDRTSFGSFPMAITCYSALRTARWT
ncbi:MAG: hypothetical protein R2818_11185 [Flavobacteriales bacterium]